MRTICRDALESRASAVPGPDDDDFNASRWRNAESRGTRTPTKVPGNGALITLLDGSAKVRAKRFFNLRNGDSSSDTMQMREPA